MMGRGEVFITRGHWVWGEHRESFSKIHDTVFNRKHFQFWANTEELLPKHNKHHFCLYKTRTFHKRRENETVRKMYILSILLTDEKHFPIEKRLKAEKPLSSSIVHFLQRKDIPLYYLQDIPLCFLYVWLKYICLVGWKNRQWYMYVFWEI